MRFSENWLRSVVDLKGVSHQDLVDKLTMSGLEVDASGPVADRFSDVVVARIERCEPHPDADKLQVCEVSFGSNDTSQIVCGAPNARQGLIAPLAMLGARLPGDFKIRKAKLRGVESRGMLCSAKELGLSDDAAGLMELPTSATLGADLRDYLDLDDQWIEIDLTPNRGDCLGMMGLAQDVAAMFGRSLRPIESPEISARIETGRSIRLDAPADCARYVGRVVEGVDIAAQTPAWISERLRRAGIKLFNPAVDVTNYVMLELGQPMHAFDLEKLSGGIHVRRASAGERLALLTGEMADLDDRFLLICDDSGPIALGGVMGGATTMVSDTTRNIFFEAAWFNPASIVGRARALGLATDSAHRFERGVDPQLQREAMERATQLLIEIAGGTAGPLCEAADEDHLPTRQTVTLRHARIGKLLGTEIDPAAVESLLSDLGMACEPINEGWHVRAPSRRFDIELEEDLIEEVVRIHGYEKLVGRAPEGAIPPISIPEQELPPGVARSVLAERGYREAITYSFVPEAWLEPLALEALPLANPLSRELAVMRPVLTPGLLAALGANQKRQQPRVRLFEYGAVFPLTDGRDSQEQHLAALAVGAPHDEHWAVNECRLDYFDIKGDLEALLDAARADARFETSVRPYLHPGQSAEIVVDGHSIGWVGCLHPRWLEQADVRGPVFGFELRYSDLSPVALPAPGALSRFPTIRRDLAFWVQETVQWQQIRDLVEETAGNLLTKLAVFDEYRDLNASSGKKSLGFGLILGRGDRTLTDEEADIVTDRVVERIRDQFAGELRG